MRQDAKGVFALHSMRYGQRAHSTISGYSLPRRHHHATCPLALQTSSAAIRTARGSPGVERQRRFAPSVYGERLERDEEAGRLIAAGGSDPNAGANGLWV